MSAAAVQRANIIRGATTLLDSLRVVHLNELRNAGDRTCDDCWLPDTTTLKTLFVGAPLGEPSLSTQLRYRTFNASSMLGLRRTWMF